MKKTNLNFAVFLDRDGTLIEDRGYIKSIDEIKFYQDVFPALSILAHKFQFFIITNQTGVGKGVITKNDVTDINSHIVKFLAKKGIIISENC